MTLADVGAILLVVLSGVIVTEIVLQERRIRRMCRKMDHYLDEMDSMLGAWRRQLEWMFKQGRQ